MTEVEMPCKRCGELERRLATALDYRRECQEMYAELHEDHRSVVNERDALRALLVAAGIIAPTLEEEK